MIGFSRLRKRIAEFAIGPAGAFAASRFLSILLYEVRQTDPCTYLQVSLILLASAAAGIYLPARRSATGNPISALREE